MLTFGGQRRPPTTSTKWGRTRSSCRKARSWPSRSRARGSLSPNVQDRRKANKHMHNIEVLKQRLDGTLILPGDPAYDQARTIWNGMIDRKPAMIVRCRTEADAMRAVKYAQENRLVVSIRGGGHNIA